MYSYVLSRIYLHNPPGGKQRSLTQQFEEGEAVPMHDVGYTMTPGSAQYFDQKHGSTTPPQAAFTSSTNLVYREDDREKATMLLEREHGDAAHAAHTHEPEIGPWPALILL
jgi:hypothetical protein